MFKGVFVGLTQLKEEKVWLEELDHKLSQRVNEIINTNDTSLFVKTIEEIEKVKSHNGFIETEIGQLRVTWKRLEGMKKNIVSFSWPSDDMFQEWKDKYVG